MEGFPPSPGRGRLDSGHSPERRQDMKHRSLTGTQIITLLDYLGPRTIADMLKRAQELGICPLDKYGHLTRGQNEALLNCLLRNSSGPEYETIADLLSGKLSVSLVPTAPLQLELEPMSLSELAKAGKHDWVHPAIKSENFPVDKSFNPNDETRLFHFGHNVSSKEVVAEMDKEGWKPATIWHLLILGIKNPEMRKQFPVIALGSIWCGLVPCLLLRGIDLMCRLVIDDLDSGWCDTCRFLAVRK